MANNPETGSKQTDEKGRPSISDLPEQILTTTDKIEQLIDKSLDTLRLADLRSEWGRRGLTSILTKAEEIGHQRGFAEGMMEEQVQDICNDIVGYMLAEVDDGRKSGATSVSLAESVEEQDVMVTHQAMIRARKIFNNADLPAQVDFHTSQNEEGNTLFNMSLIIDLQNSQPETVEPLTSEK